MFLVLNTTHPQYRPSAPINRRLKTLFNYPQGTHDDRFCAVSLAVHAAEQAPPPSNGPIARSI